MKNTYKIIILISCVLILSFFIYNQFYYKENVDYFIAPLLEKNTLEINKIFSLTEKSYLKYGKIRELEVNGVLYSLGNKRLESIEIIYINENTLKPFAVILEENVPIDWHSGSLSIMTCSRELTSLPLIIPGITTQQEKESTLKSSSKTKKGETLITRKIIITYHDYDDILLKEVLKLIGLLEV